MCVDGTLGMGGHAEAILERCPGARVIGLDRDEEALDLAASGWPASVTASSRSTRSTTRSPGARRARGRHGIRHPLRPRGLLAPARRATAASPTGTTHRSTCGWTSRPGSPPPTSSTPTGTATSPGSSGPTARSGSPAGSPRRSCASARRSRSRPRPASSRSPRRGPGGVPAHRRAPGQAHLPGAAHRGQRRARGWERAVASAIEVLAPGGRIAVLSYHSLEDRITKQAFAAGARSRTPSGCRWSCPSTRPTCGCSPAEPRCRASTSSTQPPIRVGPAACRRTPGPLDGASA